MAMLATIQFVTGATATAIPSGVLVQMNMSSTHDGKGYGGAATLVLRHAAEADALLVALTEARALLLEAKGGPVA